MSGRIGRYIGNNMSDNDNAMVYFGYEGEENKYANYAEISHSSLSNGFGRNDLFNRFYILRRELKKIDLHGHPEIKSYSAEHRSLISEYNIVRTLINESIDIKHVDKYNKEKNVYISYFLNDARFVFDLISDLEDYKFNICGDSHELPPPEERILREIAERCGVVLFVVSKHADKASLKAEYAFFNKYAEANGTPKTVFVMSEAAAAPKFAANHIDMSHNYDRQLNELVYLLST
jgi:hypothetical protein